MRARNERVRNCLGGDVSGRILRTYTDNLDTLPAKERIHFLRRAFRATGDAEFGSEIVAWTAKHTIPAVRRRAEVLRQVVEEGRPYPPVRFKKRRSQRINARNAFFEAHPDLQFFRRYLMDLFQARTVGAHETALAGEWDAYMQTLRQVDFRSLYLDDEVIEKVSSFAVNSVLFVRVLEVDIDLADEFVSRLKHLYFEEHLTLKEPLTPAGYTSLVYNLTHVVIGRSEFYQRWVTEDLWISDFFSKDVDRILRDCSFDVIAEVGLSLRLQKQERVRAEAYRKIQRHIIENYDLEATLLPERLMRSEHTNAVMMLLFCGNRKWHRGPWFTEAGEPESKPETKGLFHFLLGRIRR